MSDRYPYYRMLKTIPCNNLHAKFTVYLTSDDESYFSKVVSQMKSYGFAAETDNDKKELIFYKELLFFAECLFFDCFDSRDDELILDALEIPQLTDLAGYIWRSVKGFICEDTGGVDYQIVIVDELYHPEYFELDAEKCCIDFSGYERKHDDV